ncbi:MAG: TolC family outer membrane protein [Hyphomonadaceae bacterium]|nr:TolC family outer membrane protein [Hyphomonadaceae bacterium]
MRVSKLVMMTVASLAAVGLAEAQSLDEALALAELSNPNLDVGRTQAEIAREALEEARAQGRTRVTLGGTAGYESADSNRIFALNSGDRPLATAQIEAARPIYTGGRIPAGVRAAKAGIDAADARLEAVRQDLFFDTITAFLQVTAARATVDIRENNVRVLDEQVRAATARFDVGFITRTDVALSEARLAGALAGLAAAEAELERGSAQFESLTGVYPGALGPLPPLPALPQDFEAALAELLEFNPNLLAGREDERAASEAVRVAEAGGRATIEIVGRAEGQQDFDQDVHDTAVSALARGSIPLFQGGLVSSQVRSAKLRREQARLQVQAAERDLRAALAAAWYGYQAAERAIEASERQVEAAQIAFNGARQELSVGTRTTLDVLDSEQDLLDARLSLVNAERDAHLAAYQILALTGALSRDILLPVTQVP